MTNPDALLLSIVGACFLFVGIMGFIRDWHLVKKLRYIKDHWQQTRGTVKKSEIIRTRGARWSYFDTSISYCYSVNSKSYTNNSVTLLDTKTGWGEPQLRATEKYPVNSPVVVYFNPVNPQESVISLSEPLGASGFKVLSLTLVSSGLILMFLALAKVFPSP